jgi:[acyl-carrier-protein] S-malonyltransferase
MKRIVHMFPGVGSQHTGMCKEFYENFKIVREVFEEGCDVLKTDLVKMCFSSQEKERLSMLENSQIGLLTVSVAISRLYMEEVGIVPRYCMGHSLGEYSALCCAGVIKFRDALCIVKERGDILAEVAATYNGIMAWVINLDNKIVETICAESPDRGKEIYVSAYDAPTQSSISGPKEVVFEIGKKLEKEGAIVYPLKLTGPFHSPWMKRAADRLKAVLERYEYNQPGYPVIANHNAMLYESKESVVDNLSLQLINPVRWQDSVRHILEQGIEFAIELGPDKVLKHLLKNNTDLILTFSLGNMNDLKLIKEKMSDE